ncbi:MAG: DUF4412 domain-containing protein [Proteobacteria bacterium]|nr:DUF4412 domain-containing protein [Pseudomonadota bacterium]
MKKYILFSLSVLLLIVLAGPVRAFAIEISADVVKTGGSEQAHLSKTYIKGDKYRMEMPGQHQYTIFRQDKNVIWIVMPDSQSFMEMPYDPNQKPRVVGKFKGEMSRKLVGAESIDGHPTQKYEVTLKEGIKTEIFYEWTATDINFPIKKAAIDGSWSEEYKNIQYSVSDNLFEIPAGFKKISIPAIR